MMVCEVSSQHNHPAMSEERLRWCVSIMSAVGETMHLIREQTIQGVGVTRGAEERSDILRLQI
jgi:hypothetical protein